MSDFRLSQIAPFLEKDARTLRRWCEDGVVPGGRQTGGGHWRIRGETVQSVVAAIRPRIPKGSRRRKENAYPMGLGKPHFIAQGVTPRQAWMRSPPSARWKRKVWFWDDGEAFDLNSSIDRQRYLERVAGEIQELIMNDAEALRNYDAEALVLNLPSESAARMIADMPVDAPRIATRLTARRLAREVGVSLRTFYRRFPNWKRALHKLVSQRIRPKAFENDETVPQDHFDYDEIDRRLAVG